MRSRAALEEKRNGVLLDSAQWARSGSFPPSSQLMFSAGYPMAKNLRAKIPTTDEVFVCDTNASATNSFLGETRGMRVQVAHSPREVAEKSVW